MKILMFTLAGPMISFGETERWDHRGTEAMPTKSAIIGLLGCCLGLARGDERLQSLDEKLHMVAYRERMGPMLTDFQTVQSPTGAILNAMRKPRGSTIITPKQYIQDAVFHVFLFGDEALLRECEAAMRHPKWIVSLGRRCNPPSVPLVPFVFEEDSIDLYTLGKHVNPAWHTLCKRQGGSIRAAGDIYIRCEAECAKEINISHYPGGYRAIRHDGVVRANENQYTDRQVISLSLERSEAACT